MTEVKTLVRQHVIGFDRNEMKAAFEAEKSVIAKGPKALEIVGVALLTIAAIVAAFSAFVAFGNLNVTLNGVGTIGSNQAFWTLVGSGALSLTLLSALIAQGAFQHKMLEPQNTPS